MHGSVSDTQCLLDISKAHSNIAYAETADAKATTVGAKKPVGTGTGNSHRPALQAGLQAEHVTTTNTYNSYKSGNNPPRPIIESNANPGRMNQQPRTHADPARGKAGPRASKTRYQARPWPPPALDPTILVGHDEFMSSVANATKQSQPILTQDEPIVTTAVQSLAIVTAVSDQPSTTLVQSLAPATTGNVQPSTTPVPEVQKSVNHTSPANPNHSEIRKVPVDELAFPLVPEIAPGGVSTHTDGAPSPATFSGFTDQGSVTSDHLRLPRPLRVAKSPDPFNIMDTPILDDMSNLAVMNGQTFVSKAQFLTLQAEVAVIKQELASLKQLLATVAKSPRVPGSGPVTNSRRPDDVHDVPEMNENRQDQSEEHASSANAPPLLSAKNVGLGISGAVFQSTAKVTIKSPGIKSAALYSKSTNDSIIGDSKVLRPGSDHPGAETINLASPLKGKNLPKPFKRSNAGPGYTWLLEDLNKTANVAPPAPVPATNGLLFTQYRPSQPAVSDSDEEL